DADSAREADRARGASAPSDAQRSRSRRVGSGAWDQRFGCRGRSAPSIAPREPPAIGPRGPALHDGDRRHDGLAPAEVTRGSIVVLAAPGPYTGKPRPAVVVQADVFNATHASITVCPITSDCIDAPLFRVSLPPGSRTGLTVVSQVMVDKVASVPRVSIARE